MRLLVNTLSIGSMSGEHVVYGFLAPMIRNLGPNDHVIVLSYENQALPNALNSTIVSRISISTHWRHWAFRGVWELLNLRRLVRQQSIDLVLNASGSITPLLSVPQLSLAMNPWCFVRSARSGFMQEIKAFIQRRGYRHAFRKAANMIYISRHLRDLYRQENQDILDQESDSTIAYVGLNEDLFEASQHMKHLLRKPLSILSVSAFAPWKGVETLVEAVHLLRQKGILATLDLVGPWPERDYKVKIQALIQKLDLEKAIEIRGKLSVTELYQQYATHQVYCLMSSCESFGIPAAEAMAFGTPIVSTNCCAIAEICQGAGLFGPVQDSDWTAQALETVLTDKTAWESFSKTAHLNANRLTWNQCTQAILDMPQFIGAQNVTSVPSREVAASSGVESA